MHRIVGAVLAGSLLAAGAVPAVAAAASAGVTTAGTATGLTAPGVTVTVMRGGLNTPRQLTMTGAGLFVAEAGSGGRAVGKCVTGPPIGGPGVTSYCAGLTGAVSLVGNNSITPSLRLPSVIEEDNQEAVGPAAVAFERGGEAVAMQDVLVKPDGSNTVQPPFGASFGKLLVWQDGQPVAVDLAAFAAAHPQSAVSLGTLPGETAYDSDPFDVAAYRGGYVVADAAANSLLEVAPCGSIRLLARFPAVSELAPPNVIGNPTPVMVDAQAVPTSVAVGPDGALYVGLLRGVPSDPGTAYIYRVVPGHTPAIWARGLTAVTSIAFDSHGRLLATEYGVDGLLAPPTVPGALVRISRDGRTVTTLPVSGLFQPTGVATGPGGAVYVSNYGDNLATGRHPGEVLKITGLS